MEDRCQRSWQVTSARLTETYREPRAASSILPSRRDGWFLVFSIILAIAAAICFAYLRPLKQSASATVIRISRESRAVTVVRPIIRDERFLVSNLILAIVATVCLAYLNPIGLPASSNTKAAAWHVPEFHPSLVAFSLTNSPEYWPDPQNLKRSLALPDHLQALANHSSKQDKLFDPQQAAPPFPPTHLTRTEPTAFFVHLSGTVEALTTTRATVGAALASNLFLIAPEDLVIPTANQQIEPGMNVFIYRAVPITIDDAGIRNLRHTHAKTIGEALSREGISLGSMDRIEPDLETAIQSGMSIRITRVEEEYDTIRESIPYNTVYRNDYSMNVGQTATIQHGWEGVRHQQVRIVYENGNEMSRETLATWVDPPPRTQIVARGARATIRAAAAPVANYATDSGSQGGYTMTVWATWYNASHGGKAPGHPAYGITATGMRAGYGVVAIDPRVIPLGTRMYIPGYGYAVAGDTGGGVRGYHIDLGFPEGVVPNWGAQYVTITILP